MALPNICTHRSHIASSGNTPNVAESLAMDALGPAEPSIFDVLRRARYTRLCAACLTRSTLKATVSVFTRFKHVDGLL